MPDPRHSVDPEERGYRREVSMKEVFWYFYVSIPLVALFVLGAVFSFRLIPHPVWRVVTLVCCCLLGYFFLKRLSLGAILMYKAYAPMSMRDQCRFTPSCSTYALIAIKKYGVILGWLLALLRIRRCRPPYGGEDYPSLAHLLRLFHN